MAKSAISNLGLRAVYPQRVRSFAISPGALRSRKLPGEAARMRRAAPPACCLNAAQAGTPAGFLWRDCASGLGIISADNGRFALSAITLARDFLAS